MILLESEVTFRQEKCSDLFLENSASVIANMFSMQVSTVNEMKCVLMKNA